MKITSIRPVLLSAPYACDTNLEVRYHLPTGYRTCGLVEVCLDNGITGLGEGYLPVFAPHVFESIVRLVAPHMIGTPAEDFAASYNRLCRICDYWSFQGAARHITSAVMSALLDAVGKTKGVPAWQLLANGAAPPERIALYGSGGDSDGPVAMAQEIDLLQGMGIKLFKIRARNHEVAKARWVLHEAADKGISIGIDMTQNLARPSQSIDDIVRFLAELEGMPGVAFLEETFGPENLTDFPQLRERIDVPVTGGEIVTTAEELLARMDAGFYDWAQPDATVLGGPHEVMRCFEAGKRLGVRVVVHCWGAGVCQMANYHAAFAGSADLAEWPMPTYPLREALMVEPLPIKDGFLTRSDAPGLGVQLTPEVEAEYHFREDAIYNCFPTNVVTQDPALWAL